MVVDDQDEKLVINKCWPKADSNFLAYVGMQQNSLLLDYKHNSRQFYFKTRLLQCHIMYLSIYYFKNIFGWILCILLRHQHTL